MKLLRIKVGKWRNFLGIDLVIPPEANLVCLIGENGTGKSNLLELLSTAAHHFGLSRGNEPRRGNPLGEPHQDVEVHLRITESTESLLGEELWQDLQGLNVSAWDGTLFWRSNTLAGQNGVFAGGDGFEDEGALLGNRIVEWLRQFNEVRHVYLDADRSYPPRPVQTHELAEALGQGWEQSQARIEWAYRSTRTLYEQWAKYVIGNWQKAANDHARAEKEAADAGLPRPEFHDPLRAYGEAIQEVLPHLRPRGVVENALAFDSSGEKLTFDQLSGGEREIAFLIGQIDRFQLTRGLFFLDEPELHLNPDLLRVWLRFIVERITDGQVWISTHAMEAVEIAGPEASFVLERDAGTRIVNKADPLADRPTLAVLSQAVGSPAFALKDLRFIYIEGEPPFRGEIDRFYDLCGDREVNRFMAVGGSAEVIKNVQAILGLAKAVREPLVIGGVVDRDFMSDEVAADKASKAQVFVLGCHEIENVFLQPDALQYLLTAAGRPDSAQDVLLAASDQMAGLWVMKRAIALNSLDRAWLAASSGLRARAGGLNWAHIDGREADIAKELAELQEGLEPDEQEILVADFAAATSAYGALRASDDIWLRCMGKEVIRRIPAAVGFRTAQALAGNVSRLWRDGAVAVPTVVSDLRTYVDDLQPVEV